MIRIAILGLWHVHAQEYAEQVLKHPDTELLGVWDDNMVRGMRAGTRWGVPYYASLDDLLGNNELDAVVVTTATAQHCDVLTRSANAHKHIFSEKVIAATAGETEEILRAVDMNKVTMMVSLPWLYKGEIITMQEILMQGRLGRLTEVRSRLSHNGATRQWLPNGFFELTESQGGALIDLGSHPMYLTRLFLGMPETVGAHLGYVTERQVEDNAVVVLQYPNGALGVVEAGFVTDVSKMQIELHGTEGSVVLNISDRAVMQCRSTVDNTEPSEWNVVNLRPDRPSPFEQWIYHLQNGTRDDENLAMASDLARLTEVAYQAARDQRHVSLDPYART